MRRRLRWRRRWMGAKHGPALSVAVFRSPGGRGIEWAGPGPSTRLDEWARTSGFTASRDREGLALVDAHVAAWRADAEVEASLANEVGLYLGAVLVAQVPGARWHVWPNGHPVLRMRDGRDVDVTDVVARRLDGSISSLTAVLDHHQSA